MKGAVILAGGFSTRFDDGDKAVASVAGTPMIRRVVSSVVPVVDELVVNARTDQRSAIEQALEDLGTTYRFAFDEEIDRGPLEGMAIGLEDVSAEYTVVLACDMPFVERAFVEYLFERAAGAEAAIPVESGPERDWLQPLQAVYETESTLRTTRDALASGIESPVTAVDRLEYERVVVPGDWGANDVWTLKNVNTLDELREAERYLSREESETPDTVPTGSSNGVR